MLKVLLKRQLFEVFKGYFYDAKKNKKRSKLATMAYFILFGLIMIGILGGMFSGLSYSLLPLAQAGCAWLYFTIISLVSILLGVFGSVFNSYSSLYLSKDNDLLLSMPIPVSTIIISRILNVYLLGLMYSSVVIIPGSIIYLVLGEFSVQALIGSLVLILYISIIVLLLSCLFGFVIAKISLKFKNKSYVTTIISLVFLGLYYFFYFKAQTLISDVITNVLVYGDQIKDAAYVVYLFGGIGLGKLNSILIFATGITILTLIVWLLLKKTFLSIAISTGIQEKHEYKDVKSKQSSIFNALFRKEMQRFTSSSVYMLNCGLGLIFIIAAGVALIIKKDLIVTMLTELFGDTYGCTTILVFSIIAGVTSLVDIVVPSVSLEGKNFWIYKSLPIKMWDVIKAKMSIQLVLTIFPLLIICGSAIYGFAASESIIYLACVSTLLVLLCNTLFGMFLAIKMPVMNWTQEVYPIKQSGNVLIALLVAMAFPVGIALLYLSKLYQMLSAIYYLLIVDGVLIVLSLILYLWLKNKGVNELEELN